ncbi:hypothetical protein SUGI_0587100 [Cryptomeria japonica]|uniref:heat stress transcription factor A-2-like n=1 Tax=Cryptomeria japonica TaxID=3369 RepID=UPI0024148700|nr:heat stress transcription factor A-2-like [Cryptomeria japonica]GLJ29746.1 hypothetical protein SUGI_0587100 [Cryptomeria japonica]
MERNGAAPFLTKTYAIVDDPSTDGIISWSGGNNSFLVKDPHHFSLHLLPLHFKHSNFSSFVRQLNTYGFRKVDPDRWEFAHECFLRGQKHLLNSIRRRRTSHNQSQRAGSKLAPKYDSEGEFQRLNDDEDAIVMEVVQLKKQQESIDRELEDMQRRFAFTEPKPQQMMSFLQTFTQNPNFTAETLQKRHLDFGKKRRLLPMPHKEELKKSRVELGLDCSRTNSLTTPNGFLDLGMSSNSFIADGFEDCVPLIDSETRAGLLFKELMATCSLGEQSSEKCIDKDDFEVGFEKDFLGLSSVDDMISWDQVFAEETQFINCKVLSEMQGTQINKSPDFK